ncbi:hypothetical protein GEMRC1_001747 [Eukaryota sp. GEM-RC1]
MDFNVDDIEQVRRATPSRTPVRQMFDAEPFNRASSARSLRLESPLIQEPLPSFNINEVVQEEFDLGIPLDFDVGQDLGLGEIPLDDFNEQAEVVPEQQVSVDEPVAMIENLLPEEEPHEFDGKLSSLDSQGIELTHDMMAKWQRDTRNITHKVVPSFEPNEYIFGCFDFNTTVEKTRSVEDVEQMRRDSVPAIEQSNDHTVQPNDDVPNLPEEDPLVHDYEQEMMIDQPDFAPMDEQLPLNLDPMDIPLDDVPLNVEEETEDQPTNRFSRLLSPGQECSFSSMVTSVFGADPTRANTSSLFLSLLIDKSNGADFSVSQSQPYHEIMVSV